MARKNAKEETKLNYGAEVRSLKDGGPASLYLLWGPEDYLREQFLNELRKACLPEGEDSFSFKRMNGPELDPLELQQAKLCRDTRRGSQPIKRTGESPCCAAGYSGLLYGGLRSERAVRTGRTAQADQRDPYSGP